MRQPVTRRQAIRAGLASVVLGVAGCNTDQRSPTGVTQSSESTDTSTTAGTTEPTSVTTEGETAATATPDVDTGGTWATYQHDTRNTGFNPEATGPAEGVEIAWTAAGSSESNPTVVDGTIYLGTDGGTVYALTDQGAIDWTYSTGNKVDAGPAVADGTVVVPSRDGTLYALAADDGTEQWTASGIGGGRFTIQQGSATIADGTVYLGSMEENFYAFDLATGDQEFVIRNWTLRDTEAMVSTPAVVDGTAYITTTAGNIYAVDGESGAIRWGVNVVDGDSIYGSPAVRDGVVYAGTLGEGKLYAFDAGSGDTVWTADLDGNIHASPALAHGAVFLGAGSTLYAFERSDGTKRWSADTGGKVYASAAADSKRVYLGSYGQVVRAFDPGSGDVVWSVSDTVAFADASPTVVDGRVYVPSRTSPLVALASTTRRTTTRRTTTTSLRTTTRGEVTTPTTSTTGRTSVSKSATSTGGRPTTNASVAGETGESFPVVPVGVGAAGLLGAGLAWYVFGGAGSGGGTVPTPGGGDGGGHGGSGGSQSIPKPKPKPHDSETVRYETGVFELPSSATTLTVPIGFDPDLVLLAATNGARTDSVTDRTAGSTRGIAHCGDGQPTNRCLTVADDAFSDDRATCAVAENAALQLVRHADGSPPGRVTARVADTSGDGFDVEVSVPGDDPLAGGIRVLYRAVRTGPDSDVDVGTFETPTEPGTQTVDLGIDADHISLVTSSAVEDTDGLWTTDRGTGMSVGHATGRTDTPITQTAAGIAAWPGTGHASAAACDDDAVLQLLYQDGSTLAGRTSGSVVGLGDQLRVRYDRVYNGPHKLGSTARHPVAYLATRGDTIRPAVGTLPLPEPGRTRTIDLGVTPAMIDLVIVPAGVGEAVASGATTVPFGWSQGTAIDGGDRLRQYVLHHAADAVAPTEHSGDPSPRSTGTAAEETTADGGRPLEGSDGNGRSRTTSGEADSVAESASDTTVGSVRSSGVSAADIRPLDVSLRDGGTDDAGGTSVPVPTEHDDGVVGMWLVTDAQGKVVARDELRVAETTDGGVRLAVDRLGTGASSEETTRPTVVYRAWPADGTDRDMTTGSAAKTVDEATDGGRR